MVLEIPMEILAQIHAHGEAAYPEEGAGLLLGKASEAGRRVIAILPHANAREDGTRRNRYLITAQEMLRSEDEADRRGLDVLGVFHSHPDHPNRPSGFDREWAMPWYSYVITSVQDGRATGSRSWRLAEDRTSFIEERLQIQEGIGGLG